MSPWAPTRLCSTTGCGAVAVQRGRCQAHQRDEYRRIERTRGTARERGYDAEWRRLRAVALLRDRHCCQSCGSPATEVDHITPLHLGGARLQLVNLQALCSRCHSEKTAQEATARARAADV